jgi:hypothetical protein
MQCFAMGKHALGVLAGIPASQNQRAPRPPRTQRRAFTAVKRFVNNARVVRTALVLKHYRHAAAGFCMHPDYPSEPTGVGADPLCDFSRAWSRTVLELDAGVVEARCRELNEEKRLINPGSIPRRWTHRYSASHVCSEHIADALAALARGSSGPEAPQRWRRSDAVARVQPPRRRSPLPTTV